MDQDDVSVLLSLQPSIDVLRDRTTSQRPAKKAAIDKVKLLAFQETVNWTTSKQSVLMKQLLDPITSWSTSDIEYVREKAVLLLQSYVLRTEERQETVVQSCYERFPSEPTEEIRQAWMGVTTALLKHYSKKIQPPLDDTWFTLATLAVTDACPAVVKQGAELVTDLAIRQPEAVAYRGEHTIIHTVLPLLIHKHTAIRIMGIKAMHQVLLCSSQGVTRLRDVLTMLIHDHSALVRSALFPAIGDTLICWNPVDRYQHAESLLPILFAGTVDELEDIREASRNKLNQLGISCSQDLKEAGVIESIDNDRQVELGLKHLVHQCFVTTLKRMMDDSNDFIAGKKARALAALHECLEYVSSEDMIRSSKWVLQRLLIIMAGPSSSSSSSSSPSSASSGVREQLVKVVCDIGRLLSWPVLLDQLLPRLSKTNLMAESSQLPASSTVAVIVDILLIFQQSESFPSLQDLDKQRVKNALKFSHLTPYITPSDAASFDIHF